MLHNNTNTKFGFLTYLLVHTYYVCHVYPVWSKERKKRKSKIIDCHTLSVCPGPAENMGTVGIGRAEHRVTVGNRPNNHLLAAPLTLFDQGGQIMPFVLGCPNQL